RERQEDAMRHRADRVAQRAPGLERRGDVEDDDLVDALDVVAFRELPGIAGVAQLLELNALHDLAVADVHAGDDALGQHPASVRRAAAAGKLPATARKLRMICRPASLDFSG